MKERHHFTPLSLHGLHVPANIVVIPQHLHRHIHETMNIPRMEYSKLWRQYRKRFNTNKTITREQVDCILYMQEQYFKNYSKLCPLAKQVHVSQMNVLVAFLRAEVGHCHTFQEKWSKLWYEYKQALYNYYLC